MKRKATSPFPFEHLTALARDQVYKHLDLQSRWVLRHTRKQNASKPLLSTFDGLRVNKLEMVISVGKLMLVFSTREGCFLEIEIAEPCTMRQEGCSLSISARFFRKMTFNEMHMGPEKYAKKLNMLTRMMEIAVLEWSNAPSRARPVIRNHFFGDEKLEFLDRCVQRNATWGWTHKALLTEFAAKFPVEFVDQQEIVFNVQYPGTPLPSEPEILELINEMRHYPYFTLNLYTSASGDRKKQIESVRKHIEMVFKCPPASGEKRIVQIYAFCCVRLDVPDCFKMISTMIETEYQESGRVDPPPVCMSTDHGTFLVAHNYKSASEVRHELLVRQMEFQERHGDLRQIILE
ncbi:unnamed protein product, partial [Mesorhabditis spiculigera]